MTILYSSESPTPPIKDPRNDDPLEIFIDQYRRYDFNTPNVITSEIYDFIQRPTLKHARRLLRSYRIHEPLKHHVRKASKATKSSQLQIGRGPSASSEIFKELLYYDTLHDLILCSDTSTKIFRELSKRMLNMPREHRTLFLSKDFAFTKTVYEYLRTKANITTLEYTFDSKDTNTKIDTVLYTRLYKAKNIDLVLDNIIALQPNIHTESEATIAYVTCAFLLCFLTNMSRLNPEAINKPINIYDGLFLLFDGNYVQRFIVSFLKSLKRCTKAPKVQVLRDKDFAPPKSFNAAFKQTVSLTPPDKININGTTYTINDKYIESTTEIMYPHSKDLFCKHITNAIDTKDQNTLSDLVHLNFLRDAYKADVAVSKDAIYVTHDRLAYLYYRFIGGKRGFLISRNMTLDGIYNVVI